MEIPELAWRMLAPLVGMALVTTLMLGACTGTTGGHVREVEVDEQKISERDLEVAHQMQAPEEVLKSMEEGEWLYPSDREAVRYAELAIDHMQNAHGQTCEARWSTVPWVLADDVRVTLIAVGGVHNGAEVMVRVSTSADHSCADNWYLVVHGAEMEQLSLAVLDEALAELPRATWAAEAAPSDSDVSMGIADDTAVEEALAQGRTNVNVFFAAHAVSDKDALEALRVRVLQAYRDKGYAVYLWMVVVPDAPDGAAMSVAYGREQLAHDAELMTASGIGSKE